MRTGEALAGNCVVIIPTYNERENLRTLLPQILDLDPRYSVLVVDDNSPDGTGEIAAAFAASNPGRVEVLHRPLKQGIGRAYVAGFRQVLRGKPDFIATMDADHSHNPADLPRLLAALENADLALGSRYAPGGATSGWPLHRRTLSRFGSAYARTILGVDIHDLTGGLKVYRRAALEKLDLDAVSSDGYVFQIETTYRLLQQGQRIVEVPVTFVDRVAGRSKLSRKIILEAMVIVWKLRLDKAKGRL